MEVEANLVLDTLYAAKKYMVSVLARRCVSYLEVTFLPIFKNKNLNLSFFS